MMSGPAQCRITSYNVCYTKLLRFAASFVRINDDLYPDIVVAADFNHSQVFMNRTCFGYFLAIFVSPSVTVSKAAAKRNNFV